MCGQQKKYSYVCTHPYQYQADKIWNTKGKSFFFLITVVNYVFAPFVLCCLFFQKSFSETLKSRDMTRHSVNVFRCLSSKVKTLLGPTRNSLILLFKTSLLAQY